MASESLNYDALTVAFVQRHKYLDDDPSGTPFDEYTVTVVITDKDGGQGMAKPRSR